MTQFLCVILHQQGYCTLTADTDSIEEAKELAFSHANEEHANDNPLVIVEASNQKHIHTLENLVAAAYQYLFGE